MRQELSNKVICLFFFNFSSLCLRRKKPLPRSDRSIMDFEAKGQKFWQWLETNGAVLSDGIAFKDYRESDDAGRGVVATRDIKVLRPFSFRNCKRGTLYVSYYDCTCRKGKFYFQYRARCCSRASHQCFASRKGWQISLTG